MTLLLSLALTVIDVEIKILTFNIIQYVILMYYTYQKHFLE